MSARIRVAIDARPLSHPQAGGFKSYVRGLVQGLADTPDMDVLLYVDRPVNLALPKQFQTRVLSPDRIRTDLSLFQKQVREDSPDVVHGTMNYLPPRLRPATTLTLHDAMGMVRYPWQGRRFRGSARAWVMNRYWYLLTWLSARAANRVVTVSQGAAHELSRVLRQPQERFAVVYNGITLPNAKARIRRENRTVLVIASPDPRKNLQAVYRALSENAAVFGGEGVPLLNVVASAEKAAVRAEAMLRHYNVSRYEILRDVDDQALADAYAGATIFAWPSLLEGFGMPPVEAQQAGAVVVSSDAPPMPEVLGESPIYCDPNHPEAFATAIAHLLNHSEELLERQEQGKRHAARYTCARQAAQTAAIWREVLAK